MENNLIGKTVYSYREGEGIITSVKDNLLFVLFDSINIDGQEETNFIAYDMDGFIEGIDPEDKHILNQLSLEPIILQHSEEDRDYEDLFIERLQKNL